MIILKVEDTFQWGEGVPRREEQQPTHIVRQRHERSTTRWDPTLMPSSNIKEVLHDYHPHLFLLAVVNCGAPAPKAGWDYTNCAHSWDTRQTATHQTCSPTCAFGYATSAAGGPQAACQTSGSWSYSGGCDKLCDRVTYRSRWTAKTSTGLFLVSCLSLNEPLAISLPCRSTQGP